MRVRLIGAGFLVGLVFSAGSQPVGRADPEPATVVAHVGPEAITAEALERRLAAVPAFQLGTLGRAPAERRQALLGRAGIPRGLVAWGAGLRKLVQTAPVR